MAVPSSSVPTAKINLLNLVTAQINDTSVLVCYDEPGEYQPDDIVSVADVTRTVSPLAMVGTMQAKALQEVYVLQVIVSVFRGGDNAQTVYERACTLVDAVVAAQRNDPTLGGAVSLSRPEQIDQPGCQWETDHKGFVAEHRVHFHVLATL